MSDWAVGYAIGIATGPAIGFAAGRRQKRWSELIQKEKMIRISIVAAGVVLLAAGIVVLLINGSYQWYVYLHLAEEMR